MTILQTLMPTQRMRRRKPPRELEGLLQSLQIGVSNGDSPVGPRVCCKSSGGKNALSRSKPPTSAVCYAGVALSACGA